MSELPNLKSSGKIWPLHIETNNILFGKEVDANGSDG